MAKIAVLGTFYSEGMGYGENCVSRSLASLGHDVHLLASNYNVYGDSPEYDRTYREFLGPADQGTGTFRTDGYTVHRLPSTTMGGYVRLTGLAAALRALRPDVVHAMEIASLQTYQAVPLKPVLGFKLFAESHQHMSVVRPYLLAPGSLAKKAVYRLTRTLPTFLASLAVERCYAISPDCVEVARRFYGVPASKIQLQSLGTDTALFRPPATDEEWARRRALRAQLGFTDDDVVCLYTGRFSDNKNPLVLARAVAEANGASGPFRSLFVGEGSQRAALAATPCASVVPFMRYTDLAEYYRLADVACWPREESMSMLDAAASGLPLLASDRMGERARVDGNGAVFRHDDVADLAAVLRRLASSDLRRALGAAGRAKMVAQFSWMNIARSIEADYRAAGAPV